MARRGKPNKQDNRKGRSKLYRHAARDVRLAARPARRQARQEARSSRRTAEQTYGGYQEALAGITPPDYAGLQGDLSSQLASFAGLLQGEGLPATELGAGTGVFQGVGEGGLALLANMAARGAEYQTSAEREGLLAQRYATGSINQQLADALSNLRATPAQIQARMDELRQQNLENRLVRSDLQANDAFARFLMDQIGATLKSERKRGRRRGRNR